VSCILESWIWLKMLATCGATWRIMVLDRRRHNVRLVYAASSSSHHLLLTTWLEYISKVTLWIVSSLRMNWSRSCSFDIVYLNLGQVVRSLSIASWTVDRDTLRVLLCDGAFKNTSFAVHTNCRSIWIRPSSGQGLRVNPLELVLILHFM
jgi:hypothetical protein